MVARSEVTATPRVRAAARRRTDLFDAILAVEQAASRPATDREAEWMAAMHDAVADLHHEIVDHIDSTEHPEGLYQEILELTPRLAHRIDVLRAEHDEMRMQVEAILTDVAGDPPTSASVDRLRAGTRGLLALLMRHRQRGADLVWEAYNLDIGNTD